MSKLIFYKETAKHKLGDIVEGHIDSEGNIYIYYTTYDDVTNDKKYADFLANYFAIKYPPDYPVMDLIKWQAEWREQQINSILND